RNVNNLLSENDYFMQNDVLKGALDTEKNNEKVVVFVDDDKVQHMINKKILLKINPKLKLNFFESPLLALNWLTDNKADLLLLDINMPKMKGWELLDRLEEKEITIDVKMSTSSVALDDIQRSRKYDCVSALLVKPLQEAAVEEFIRS